MAATGKVVIVVSARMASFRYPAKAVAPLAGRPLLEHLLLRMQAVRGCDGVVLATSANTENAPLAELAERAGVRAYRGDEDDVLRRYIDCARTLGAEHVVRVTGDNPLTDVGTIEALVALHREQGSEYTYVPGDALLMGILAEVISVDALERAWKRGEEKHRSELMTLYIKENPSQFRINTLDLPPDLYRPQYRLTVDEADDVTLMQAIFDRLYTPGTILQTRDAIALLDREPALAAINAHLQHKPGNRRSVALDEGIPGGERKSDPGREKW